MARRRSCFVITAVWKSVDLLALLPLGGNYVALLFLILPFALLDVLRMIRRCSLCTVFLLVVGVACFSSMYGSWTSLPPLNEGYFYVRRSMLYRAIASFFGVPAVDFAQQICCTIARCLYFTGGVFYFLGDVANCLGKLQ